ncbi:MAG: TonB-dependent receptor plug domain-containing protein [Capnocytophaga sp.]|nr:TonB-dependent receptor plug domain-containing protein [Capnocytophaga sp.]
MKNKSIVKRQWNFAFLALVALVMMLVSTQTLQAQVTHIKIDDNPNRKINGPEPLYVIDGKEVVSNELRKFSPDNIESVNVLKSSEATKKYGEKGKNGVVEIQTKGKIGEIIAKKVSEDEKGGELSEALIIIDGKESDHATLSQIDPKNIETVSVLKDLKATETYGEKGKNGVVLVKMKK